METLNATVEAKDPYTAGHSRRVQRIAVAVGEELGFTPKQLEALRFGGMFHDIGKLAIPDSILTKPAKLTPEEYERIKEHSAEGARIVAKLGRLREAVPIIRHHHERWDGRGYPDGLAGTEIPLAAAVVGLADAWDMTTGSRTTGRWTWTRPSPRFATAAGRSSSRRSSTRSSQLCESGPESSAPATEKRAPRREPPVAKTP